jgi:6-phospho-3-hexuloisomerase
MSEEAKTSVFDVLRTRLDGVRRLADSMDESAAEKMVQMMLKAPRLFVTGKGRSGLMAESFAMRLMQMGFEVHVPGEATCPRIKVGDLMIAISCSGTTMTTVQLARIAHNADAQIIAVTSDPNSPLAAQSDHVVLVPVSASDVKKSYRYVLGPYNNTLFEEAVLLFCDALLYSILGREGIPARLLEERHTNLE